MRTLEDLVHIADQSLEIMGLVSSGDLDPTEVSRALDQIIASKQPARPNFAPAKQPI